MSQGDDPIVATMLLAVLSFLHVLGATVWTGGHLVLATSVLPRALKDRDPESIQTFEQGFERVGIPALLLQVVTGLSLGWLYHPSLASWFTLTDHTSRTLVAKLVLLALTVVLAAHARLSIIPNLTAEKLPTLAVHIVGVTTVSVLFVLVGVNHRLPMLF